MTSAIPVPEFFREFPMQGVRSAELETVLGENSAPLTILFLWGRDCPNCDIAKRAMLDSAARFRWPEIRWLHGNVYEDPALGTRFGLHGIPAFIVFRGVRKLGKITPWPGADAFAIAIDLQIGNLAHRSSARDRDAG